jgi:hypothetical protein
MIEECPPQDEKMECSSATVGDSRTEQSCRMDGRTSWIWTAVTILMVDQIGRRKVGVLYSANETVAWIYSILYTIGTCSALLYLTTEPKVTHPSYVLILPFLSDYSYIQPTHSSLYRRL